MPGFLYYLPDAQPQALPQRLAAAFPHADPDGRAQSRAVTHGPDGRPGTILADPNRVPPPQIGYWPDRQQWRKHHAADAWVGFYQLQPPGPADLAVARPLPGHAVTLTDGRPWQIPLARGLADEDEALVYYVALPRTSQLDDAGQWIPGAVVPALASLWELALAWWNAKAAAPPEPASPGSTAEAGEPGRAARAAFDFAGLHDAAVQALGTNYRLGPVETAALGLLTQQTAADILDALIDWPTLAEWVKKKRMTETTSPTPGP